LVQLARSATDEQVRTLATAAARASASRAYYRSERRPGPSPAAEELLTGLVQWWPVRIATPSWSDDRSRRRARARRRARTTHAGAARRGAHEPEPGTAPSRCSAYASRSPSCAMAAVRVEPRQVVDGRAQADHAGDVRVPASNLAGIGRVGRLLERDERIMSPPPGTAAASSSSSGGIQQADARRPETSCDPRPCRKSHPRAWTSTGICGAACAPSTSPPRRARAPRAAISAIGLIVPSGWTGAPAATSLVRGEQQPFVLIEERSPTDSSDHA